MTKGGASAGNQQGYGSDLAEMRPQLGQELKEGTQKREWTGFGGRLDVSVREVAV